MDTQNNTDNQGAAPAPEKQEKTMAEIISHFSAAVDALGEAVKCSQVTDSRRQDYIDAARAEMAAINS